MVVVLFAGSRALGSAAELLRRHAPLSGAGGARVAASPPSSWSPFSSSSAAVDGACGRAAEDLAGRVEGALGGGLLRKGRGRAGDQPFAHGKLRKYNPRPEGCLGS